MKLLVLLSADFGELGCALYFLQGVEWGERPMVLVSNEAHRDIGSADIDVTPYATLKDAQETIQAYQPDCILLFSGYLLSMENLFSALATTRLIRYARAKGIQVVTTDPFVGILGQTPAIDFSSVLGGQGKGLKRLLASTFSFLLNKRLSLLQWALRDCVHIYPCPINNPDEQSGPERLGFFNDNILSPEDFDLNLPEAGECREWVFVISQIDFDLEYQKQGAAFISAVANQMCNAIALKRRAVLIAPARMTALVGGELPTDGDYALLDSLPYADYSTHLARAEYAFYWNFFSFSIMARLLNSKPVLFFGRGHMAGFMPAIVGAGIESFYRGWEPPILDCGKLLTLECIARESLQVLQAAETMLADYRRLAPPDRLMDEIWQGRDLNG